ncbi:hypothetical protein B0H66DRAFT_550738 [Apodospora peruviana]|uniref:Sulfate transporter protein n=1 Tax=Apodospora peruviana TaxID=516989 RepID=A0AAE0IK26_9PEZI|nr:hypothetical protein B0H66DRAFT_550738 [Apodospora peruviana]
MAVFVDLDDEDIDPPQDGQPPRWNGTTKAIDDAVKAAAKAAAAIRPNVVNGMLPNDVGSGIGSGSEEAPNGLAVRENPNWNSMTQALGCYPIIMSVAASIDLNTLDNLSRTCRQVRANLLQYRAMLVVSTLHCSNEHLPVDPEETLRYRARAQNWFYMEEAGRTSYIGKSGQCARDLVDGCRRCGMVVCRNCAIKPPAPIVLRDRHRRLCVACTKAPLGCLVKPRLDPSVSLFSDAMQRAICKCDSSTGVWLCQPCGRTIRSDDYDYKSIWKWRNQYTDVLGGLGTGIGEGDRGVICGRDDACCAAREREQEMDCDTQDAASHANNHNNLLFGLPQSPSSSTAGSISANNGGGGSGGSPSSSLSFASSISSGSSSPLPSSSSIKPGYERHEIEGIGGVMKQKLLRMVKVGACVPEWVDEKANGEILGREVRGAVRSWCGWCWRVIPGAKDYADEKERDQVLKKEEKGKEKEIEKGGNEVLSATSS